MAQPTPYDRQSSFTLLAQVNPSTPYEGTDLDAEFNAVKVTLDDILASLVRIQRDDGFLANQSVGPDQLASSIDIGINPPSAWMAATDYSLYDTTFNGTSLYRSTVSHTSGTLFVTDLAAGKWELLADFNVVSIADGSVTTVKIADAAVTGAKIANANVTVAKIADLAVETAKINDLAVTVAKLAANSVATAKLQDDAVTVDKLAPDAVVTTNLVDANVTNAKLANMATSTFKGRIAAGTGAPQDLTQAQATALLNPMTGDAGAGGVQGAVPAPAAGDAAARKFLGAAGTWSQPAGGAPDIILEDQKTSGTDGGTFTSGADRTRTLNTEVRDSLSICSLSSNQFTISTAGTYYIEWSCPARAVDVHQSLLRDITGAADLKRGESMLAYTNSSATNRSAGCHVFTIAGPNVFEIRHRCGTTVSTAGFGGAGSFGTELYTWVKIWKVA